MIRAQHKSWALFLFNFYLPQLLRRHFSRFCLINDFPEPDKDKSLLMLPNHMSWWDGFFAYWIGHCFTDKKIFMMVLEEQLHKLWFFQKIGAFSIDPSNGVSSRNSLRYVTELLSMPQNLVVIFPQGEIQPFGKEPVKLKEGWRLLANDNTTATHVLPVAFKIQYQEDKKPAIFCRFADTPFNINKEEHTLSWADAFVDNIVQCNKTAMDNTYRREIDL